jgi:hypothetical protein
VESKFSKSQTNRGTENAGLALLLSDARFQWVDVSTKRRILELIGASELFGIQTFDAIMTPTPLEPITIDNVDRHYPQLRLIEMKTTKKPIADASLDGFFFGATEREYAMAKALGDRYLFAFIVLNDNNEYRKPFGVLLTLEEVQRRTRASRIQYQVNFRTDMAGTLPEGSHQVLVLGVPDESPSDPGGP